MVTPFAAGGGAVLMQGREVVRCAGDAAYWSIPDSLLEGYASFGPELKHDRFSWITAAALTHACADAGIRLSDVEPERIGLVLGQAFAGQSGMINFANEVTVV